MTNSQFQKNIGMIEKKLYENFKRYEPAETQRQAIKRNK
jgi:hypothetical protein